MDSDEKVLPKGLGSQTSSSAINTPEENEQVHHPMNGQESLLEFLKSFPKKELVCSSLDKERKQSGMSKCEMVKQNRMGTKGCKNLDLKKILPNNSAFINIQALSRKQPRKGEHPSRLPSSTEASPDFGCAKTWVCKNSACKAVLASEDTFCKRCSCCICHLFDDNKDPSLWLVCTSESGEQDSCGLSCHIECALQHQKVGIVDLGQLMQLDGSYCCASCGKISGILGCWKKQLAIAKDARRVDVLCYRISLSHRLLDGSSRFKELHEIVGNAKAKLETEVDPVSGISAKLARGIVSRLSVAGDVQKLCYLAIEKADEWLSSAAHTNANFREDFLPAACRFQFEDITSSTLVIVLKEACPSESNAIKGYKLWYCESREQPREKEPVIFPRNRRRIVISNLQPCTEYTFRIISFTETGDLGHSESKCFTKSVEIFCRNLENFGVEGGSSSAKREAKLTVRASSGFRVRDLGRVLHLAWAQEQGGLDGFCSDGAEEESCGGNGAVKAETAEQDQPQPSVSRGLDLNVASVPDLNAEPTEPLDGCPDEDNGCTSEKNGLARSDRSSDSQTWAARPVVEVPAVESRPEVCRKRSAIVNEENYDGDNTLVSDSPLRFPIGYGRLDDHYEYCVMVIRWLECGGYFKKYFRKKFLTWFSLRSTEQERRVVHTFIDTLVDDPNSLAGQLLDSFSEIISCKRPRNGFCSKLWH